MTEVAGRLFLDDSLADARCAALPECREIVGNFRWVTGRLRRQRALYLALTPSELAAMPAHAIEANALALGALDLDAYPDEAALLEAARNITEKKGRVTREIAKAERAGYYVKEFAFPLHVPDAVAIHRSKDIRNGRPVEGKFYLSSVEDLGGAPREPVAIPVPVCPCHYRQHWGIFQRVEGYRQGDVQTNEQLVGYIRLRRQGASASYSVIMGHGDHRQNGIMFMLHYRLAAEFIRNRPPGLRYLIYQHYTLGPNDPLGNWKHRALFKPFYLYYVDDRPIALPAAPPMPNLGEGMMALKATLEAPWPHAVEIGKELGIPQPWISTLHQAWVIENVRAPQLLLNLLRNSPLPSIDFLRPLASNLFPIEFLADATRVAAFLTGIERGLDTLLPLVDAKVNDVHVHHKNVAELDALRETYPSNWQYQTFPETMAEISADVAIIEAPPTKITTFVRDRLIGFLGGYSGKLLLSINGYLLNQFKCAEDQPAVFAERLSMLLGRTVTCKAINVRCADPEDMYWAQIEIGPPI